MKLFTLRLKRIPGVSVGQEQMCSIVRLASSRLIPSASVSIRERASIKPWYSLWCSGEFLITEMGVVVSVAEPFMRSRALKKHGMVAYLPLISKA